MRACLATALLAAGLACAPPCAALPPVPMAEIVETVRALAAEQLGRKPAEVDTMQSLFAQGLSEQGFSALVIAIEDEFAVVFSDDELRRAKWNDPVTGLSVRRLAALTAGLMQTQSQ